MQLIDILNALKEGVLKVLKFIASDPVIFEGGLLDGLDDEDDDDDGTPNTIGTTCYHRHH